ncbi:MAG: hypothetical protein KDC95_21070 [Planctomycetes bacterium]|nr:hypothetical protein [Planctomycetota bacterium]
MKRFEPIDDEVSVLLETHRHVLAWNRFSAPPFASFLVSLHKREVRAFVDSIDDVQFDHETDDGELRMTREGTRIILSFSRRGDDATGRHVLSEDASNRFMAALRTIAGVDRAGG